MRSDAPTNVFANITPTTPAGVTNAQGFRIGDVQNGLLGEVDFTKVPNGVYLLVLKVRGGPDEVSTEVRIAVESDLRIGQFSFSEQDLVIPVNGIPLTVVRTYNSFNTVSGDFGYNWTYALSDMDVVIDEERAMAPALATLDGNEALDASTIEMNLRTGGGRNVTLNLPDGRRATFLFAPRLNASGGAYGAWESPPGSLARLTMTGDSLIVGYPWPHWQRAGQTPYEYFDIPEYELEAEDGTKYLLRKQPEGGVPQTFVFRSEGAALPETSHVDALGGKLKVTKITRPSGEIINIGAAQIDFVPAGESTASRSFYLQRDANGRISEIRDSSNSSDASVKYEYHEDTGNLLRVHRLVSRNPAKYAVTTYRCDLGSFPHYITSVEDARGLPAARTEYFDAGLNAADAPNHGRLKSITDANGRKTSFEYAQSGFEDPANPPRAKARVVVRDNENNATVQETDEFGNVIFTKDALGFKLTREFGAGGEPTLLTKETSLTKIAPGGPVTSLVREWKYEDPRYKFAPSTVIADYALGTPENQKRKTTIEYNGFGQQTKIVEPAHGAGVFREFVYNSRRQLLSENFTGTIPAAAGKVLGEGVYHSEPDGRLHYTLDAAGACTVYVYYLADELEGETLVGRRGDLKSVQVRDGAPDGAVLSEVVYHYDASGNRTKQKSRRTVNGSVTWDETKFDYDPQGRLTKQTDATGATSETVYNLIGRVASTTDRYNATTRYFYDRTGDQTCVRYADGTVTLNAIVYVSADTPAGNPVYFKGERQVTVTDRYFRSSSTQTTTGTRTTYDKVGRVRLVEKLKDIQIAAATFLPGVANPSAASLDIATSTEPDLVCDTTFVSASALTPTPVTTATAYYEDGKVMGTRDANGKWTMHDYDEAGQVWRTRAFVNPDGSEIAGVTITTLFNYDKNGNQTGVLDPNQFEAIGGWPAANASNWRTRAFSDNPTRCTITTFDQMNRPTRVDLPSAGTSAAFAQSKFDWAGRKWLEIDADSKATAYVYDALGRLNWVITDLNPATTALPNPLPADFYTHAWTARQADSTVTRYGYDEVGNLIAQTDGNGRKTEFAYDGIGRRIARKLAGNVWQNGVEVPAFEYWQPDYNSPANGPKLNQTRHLDLNGRYVLNRYDSMGREIERRPDGRSSWAAPLPAGGDVPVAFTYTSTGQRASMTDASGTTRYAYDERNLLRIKQSSLGTIYYAYDAAGNVTEIDAQYGYTFASATDAQFDPARRSATQTRPSGAYMRYQYDNRNRLWKAFDTASGTTAVASHGFDPAGSLTTVALANGVSTSYDYNVRSQLRRVRTLLPGGGLLANYDHDEAGSAPAIATARNTWGARLLSNSGRRNRLVESGASSATIDYDYDNLNRLAKESVGGDYLQYDSGPGYEATGYDPAGNRRGRSRMASSTRYPNSVYGTSASTTQAYDQNDRLDNDTTAATPSTLFDGNGNAKSHGGVSYDYDFENRLLTASTGPVTLTCDGDGNRVKKVSPSGTVYYLIDDRNPTGYAQVLEEQPTPGAAPEVTYLYGLQRASQKRLTGTTGTYYYGYDGLGSVRHLTTKSVSGFTDGSVSDAYNYDAFGVKLPSSSGSTTNNYGFAGEQWDANLGMYYNRARFYHPDLGRFWSMDTFEGSQSDPLSLHKYLYCAADPVNRIDPSGNESMIGVMSAGAIGNSLQGMYNGVVSATGNAIQSTLFGIQAGHSANDILSDFILGETGLGLFVDGYNAMRNAFSDPQEAEVAAYMAWEEQMIATIIAAMEDNEFGEITLEIVPQCFVAGTPVGTEGGLKPIEQIRVGDKVWAWNESTDQVTLRPVVNRFIHKRGEIFEIQAGRDVLKVTGEHPFFIAGKGWTATRDIKAGDFFVTQDDESLVIDRIDRQQGEFLVYNFEVSTDHNYYVGEEAVLTHNANALRKAMRLNNPLLAAHHIVALRAQGAARARTLLAAAGIGLNDVRNGVALPRNLKVTPPHGFGRATVHSVVHTDKYYRELTRRLSAVAPGQRVQVLRKAARQLSIEKFPY